MSVETKKSDQQSIFKIRTYSESTKISHVSKWRTSGMSMSQYCKGQSISVSALSKWIKCYDDKLFNDSFKEVSLKSSSLPQQAYVAQMIEIKMPNGVQLKLPLDSRSFSLVQLLGGLPQCN